MSENEASAGMLAAGAPGVTSQLKLGSAVRVYIEPGAPWQNPFVESFHSWVGDELL